MSFSKVKGPRTQVLSIFETPSDDIHNNFLPASSSWMVKCSPFVFFVDQLKVGAVYISNIEMKNLFCLFLPILKDFTVYFIFSKTVFPAGFKTKSWNMQNFFLIDVFHWICLSASCFQRHLRFQQMRFHCFPFNFGIYYILSSIVFSPLSIYHINSFYFKQKLNGRSSTSVNGFT